MNLLEKALEYIFLPSCGVCNKLGEGYLCEKCGKELYKYAIFLEDTNKNGTYKDEEIEKLHIFKYKELVRRLIIAYKFNSKSYLHKTFCEFIVKNKKAFDFIQSYDIIIPVPIHKKKKAKRGYNQSELIAKELAKATGIEMDKKAFVKVKNNKVQSSLNKEERKNNVKNVYKLKDKEKIENKKILIFDDIYTTGATIEACIKEISKANIKQIGILTLAKD